MSRSSWRGSAKGRVTAPEVNFRVPSRRLEWSWGWGEHREGGRSGLGVLRCPGIGFPMFHVCSAAASNICLLTDDKKKKKARITLSYALLYGGKVLRLFLFIQVSRLGRGEVCVSTSLLNGLCLPMTGLRPWWREPQRAAVSRGPVCVRSPPRGPLS